MPQVAIVCSVMIALLTPCLGQRKGVRAPSQDIPEYWKAFQSREDKGSLTKAVLKNGLTILIEEQALRPLAAVLTYVKAGHFQENDEVAGVSSLIGRLLVRAASRGDGREITGVLGSALTVETSYDRTCYLAVTPSENVMRTMEVHAALLEKPDFTASQIGVETSLLAEEIERQAHAPRIYARRRLLELTYPAHPLGLAPAGNRETLSKATGEQLIRFHQTHYDPKNVILAVSGEVRREQILQKVVSLYASLKPSREVSSPAPAAQSSPTSFRYQHLRGKHEQPYVSMAYRVPGISHADYYPLLLLSYSLGSGRASLLHQSVVNSGAAVIAKSSLEAFQGGGTFFITLALEPEKAVSAETDTLAQLQVLKRQGIDRGSLDRAKALLVKRFYESLEAVEERVYLLARSEVLGSYLDWERLPQQIEKIGPRQVAKVLNRYLSYSNLSLLEYFPEKAEARNFTTQSFLETMRLLVPEQSRKREAEMKEQQDDQKADQQEDTFEVPDFKPNYHRYDLRKTSILRGPEIYFREEHIVPLVHFGFFFPGGRANETKTNAGITELMLRTRLHGTEEMEESFLWNHLERLGAEVSVVNEPDFFGFQATVLSSHLGELLSTFVQWTFSPQLEEKNFQRARQKALTLIRQEKENDLQRLLGQAQRELFLNHPYGFGRYGTEKTLSTLGLSFVQNWARTQMSEVHPLIVVSGDIEGTSFLRDWVSSLSHRDYRYGKPVKKEISMKREDTGAGPTLRSTLKDQAERRTLVVTFPGPQKGTRNELVLQVIERVLAGSGGRFHTLLRNQPNLAYDVGIFHVAGLSGGGIFAYLATSPENEEKALAELLKELDALRNVPLRKEELLEALVASVGSFYVHRQRGGDHLLELTRDLLSGEDIRGEQDYLSTIKGITRDDVMAVAGEYFQLGTKSDSQVSSSRRKSQQLRLKPESPL